MDQKIIDGRKLALLRQQKLVEQIKKLNKTPKIVSILVGDDPPSVLYTKIKQNKAEEIGINFQPIHFESASPHVKWEAVCSKIRELNNDESVNGIMIQLPLPEQFLKGRDEKELLRLIVPEKDVDGLNYAQKVGPFVPAAVKAVLSILEDENIKISDKHAVVVGASDLVGKPVAEELKKAGAIVEICDSQTADLESYTLSADILVSATGVPKLITGDMVKCGVVVIDVGASSIGRSTSGREIIVGDVDFQSVYPKASKITPVPGGVGPMTVISLMENVVEAIHSLSSHA